MPIDAKLVERLYRQARAERWRVPIERFAEALERSAERGGDLRERHLEDLALACACAAGDEAAWEHFVREHRPVLYRAADALDPGGGARDLADSLYGELFERSLFRYFHGRSSLATWLRAVLAQRYVDRLRAGRRFEPLLEDDSGAAARGPAKAGPYTTGLTTGLTTELDEDRDRYLDLIQGTLQRAVATLPPRERLRLACYYAQGLTLAETGRLLGEHEATCSRQLARTRRTLRDGVERELRVKSGLNDAEIAECFASVSRDAGPLDLGQLLGVEGRKESAADRSK